MTRASDKEFTYGDCIKFSQAKTKAIAALQLRLDAYYEIVSQLAEKNTRCDPYEILREFTRTDFRYPLHGAIHD